MILVNVLIQAVGLCQNITPDQTISETEYCLIVRNRTAYEMWEHHDVIDHLMVLPKRHVHSLTELSDIEALDVMQIYGQYEADGYNLYARAGNNPRRSVHHQHTHLIKIGPKPARAGIYSRKPYFHITF